MHSYTEIDKQRVLSQLSAFVARNGRLPQLREMTKVTKDSMGKTAILSMFGTWSNFLLSAGYEKPVAGKSQYKDLIPNLRKAILINRTTDRDILRKQSPDLVKDRSVYELRFGSWKNAINQAVSNAERILLKSFEDYSGEDPVLFLMNKVAPNGFNASQKAYIQKIKSAAAYTMVDGKVPVTKTVKHMRFESLAREFICPTFAVILAGFEPIGKNTKPAYTTYDGHTVDSLLELEVDKWLFDNNYKRKLHPKYPNSRMIADFQVNDVYIEILGFLNTSKSSFRKVYIKKIQRKFEHALSHNLPIIFMSDFSHESQSCLRAALDSDIQMNTPRIAGIALESIYHNVISNDKRDGLKNDGIGQSAAELPYSDITNMDEGSEAMYGASQVDEDMVRPYAKA